MDSYLLKKTYPVPEKRRRFIKKLLNLLLLSGSRSIDDDDQIGNPSVLTEFVFLYKRHVSVDLHAVIIITVIKALRIDSCFLPHHRKLSEELPEIRFLSVLCRKHPGETSRLIPCFSSKSLKLCLKPLSGILPVIVQLLHRNLLQRRTSAGILRVSLFNVFAERRTIPRVGISIVP